VIFLKTAVYSFGLHFIPVNEWIWNLDEC